ncbi:hypothetical protein H5410_010902 [Solanum commersonii]|uniref:Uncharacterized protein n=1 Tax=Solanum commersonii TaxID=4109 RepID=A0A9J6AMU7_SOLCO|nr:hypothetical protein H5410_010902 [Solanum commersonii]
MSVHFWTAGCRGAANEKIVRQIGQYGVCTNHESMHLTWKLWLQFVSNLQLSPVLNVSKNTVHSEKKKKSLQ